MAGTGFKMDFKPALKIVRTSQRKITRTAPVMKAIGVAMVSSTGERFEDSKAPGGEAWEKLAGPRKSKKGKKADKPLVDTAVLKNSVAAESGKKRVAWGTNVIYAGTHQEGRKNFKAKSGRDMPNIPARPFVGINDNDIKTAAAILKKHMTKALLGK